uniref:Uncharacterized protein n=1 Tax=Tanacetum cinerariifolium TaxID=118510 RepID=A0A6L2NDB4_TANCI|nr:hypothetical protein [Tanacetum cinerariifolium]
MIKKLNNIPNIADAEYREVKCKQIIPYLRILIMLIQIMYKGLEVKVIIELIEKFEELVAIKVFSSLLCKSSHLCRDLKIIVSICSICCFNIVEGDKPPKDKGISSGSGENNIDQYDPLFLYSNDTNGVPIIGFKLEDMLKEHNQLLKLMQFIMGLDEVYAPIRSIILTTYHIPDVKGAFATLCFELVGHPPNFKKNNNSGFNKGASSSNSVSGSKDQSTSNSFTDEQFKKLMALISEKSGSNSMPANIAVVEVSKLNITVGHPNGTKVVVTHMGSLRLIDQIVIHDVLVVPGYEVSLLSVHKLSKDNKLGHPADQVLNILKAKLDLKKDSGDNICDVCHKAKQTRDSFLLSEHKSKVLEQLAHLDV